MAAEAPNATAGSGKRTGGFVPFLIANLTSQLGSAAAVLAMAVVASNAGTTGAAAATYTALLLTLNFGVATIVTPYAGRIGHRWGVRRTFIGAQLGGALVFAAAAALIAAGVPGFPVLLASAPLQGAFGGLSHIVSPLVLRAYAAGEDLASAEANLSLTTGAAWVVGAFAGGWLLDSIGAPAALTLDVVLTVPLIAFVGWWPPAQQPATPHVNHQPWRSLVRSLVASKKLRTASALGVASALFIAPLTTMLVPITRGLQHDLAVHAAVLLASLAIGEMLAPVAVKRLKRTGTSIRPSALALFLGGVVLVLVALLVSALDGGAELVAVAAFLIVFGAVTYSASSFLIAGAADSIADDAQAGLAAFFISVGIATPIGTLLWGRLIDFAGPGSSMLLSGVAMAVVALATVGVVLWIYRRSAPANAEGAGTAGQPEQPAEEHGINLWTRHGLLRRMLP